MPSALPWLVLALVAAGPVLGGGFAPWQRHVAEMAMAAAALWQLAAAPRRWSWWLDGPLGGLTLLAMAGEWYGVFPHGSADAALGWGALWAAASVVAGWPDAQRAGRVAVALGGGAALVAVASALGYAGLWPWPGALSEPGPRLAGPLGYANALAALALAGAALSVAGAGETGPGGRRAARAALSAGLLWCLALTESRAAWLLAPPSLAAAAWLAPRRRAAGWVAATSALSALVGAALSVRAGAGHPAALAGFAVAAGLGAAAGLVRGVRWAPPGRRAGAWAAVGAAAALAVLCVAAAARPVRLGPGQTAAWTAPARPGPWSARLRGGSASALDLWWETPGGVWRLAGGSRGAGPAAGPVPAGAAAVRVTVTGPGAFRGLAVSGPGGAVWRPSLWAYRVLPAPLAGRLASVRAGSFDLRLRLALWREALALWSERPLLGWGGGGWAAAYLSRERWAYYATEAHSVWLQELVDGGAVGLGLLALAAGAGLCAAWGAVRGRRPGAAGLAVGAAALLAHGSVDFDLSYWSLAGWVAVSLAALGPVAERAGAPGRLRALALAGAASGLCVAGLWLAAWAYGARGDALAARHMALSALGPDLKAAALEPGDPVWQADAGWAASLFVPVAGPGYGRAAEALLGRAVADEPTFPAYRLLYGQQLVADGRYAAGVAELERAVELAPQQGAYYEALAEGAVAAAKGVAQRDPALAARYLEAAASVLPAMARARAAEPPGIPEKWRLPADTSVVAAEVGIADLALGRLGGALGQLRLAWQDPRTRADAAAALAVAYAAAGDRAAARAYAAWGSRDAGFRARVGALVRLYDELASARQGR